MSTRFKINYNEWSDEASPISKDVKVKTSHNKLVSQKQNADARGEWAKKNPDKQKKIAISGGKASNTKEQREKLGITDGLVRVSCGIEDKEDLMADIAQALDALS